MVRNCPDDLIYITTFLYIWQCKSVEQELNHKCAMIHCQNVNISDKNYNLLSRVKCLPLKLVFKFFTVSTIKLFMRLPSWCYACQHQSMARRTRNFYTRFFRVSKLKSALLLCNYCTIALYFVCCMVSYLFICGSMELNL